MPATWYFDVVSPFAYLQWHRLRPLLATHDIRPVPILFAAVLSAIGNRGPAEIPAKRRFMYRQLLWTAGKEGVTLRFPPAHPFNPLAALRLCIAAGSHAAAVDMIFDWIWRDGRAADDVAGLGPLGALLGIDDVEAATSTVEAKETLRRNTDAAIAAGVFGVPTLSVHGELFWGNDAHALMAAVLDDPALLQQPEWQRLDGLPVAVQRRR